MHVGWSLLVGLVALKASRSPVVRGFFALHPAMMAISVTATGNHYFLDSLAGALVALLALGLLQVVPATRSSLCRAASRRRATSAATPPAIARISCRGSSVEDRIAA
jgi:membrane-associated phospholipid phosphatase